MVAAMIGDECRLGSTQLLMGRDGPRAIDGFGYRTVCLWCATITDHIDRSDAYQTGQNHLCQQVPA